MITGAHVLLYTTDPDADRAFFRDVLEFRSVDAGHGWLIFALPPSEMALHPIDGQSAPPPGDDAAAGRDPVPDVRQRGGDRAVARNEGRGVQPARHRAMGRPTSLRLPSGGALGLYQPTHLTAI